MAINLKEIEAKADVELKIVSELKTASELKIVSELKTASELKIVSELKTSSELKTTSELNVTQKPNKFEVGEGNLIETSCWNEAQTLSFDSYSLMYPKIDTKTLFEKMSQTEKKAFLDYEDYAFQLETICKEVRASKDFMAFLKELPRFGVKGLILNHNNLGKYIPSVMKNNELEKSCCVLYKNYCTFSSWLDNCGIVALFCCMPCWPCLIIDGISYICCDYSPFSCLSWTPTSHPYSYLDTEKLRSEERIRLNSLDEKFLKILDSV